MSDVVFDPSLLSEREVPYVDLQHLRQGAAVIDLVAATEEAELARIAAESGAVFE